MKTRRLFLLAVILPVVVLLLENSCASRKGQKVTGISFDTVLFGKTGGFTNLTESYCLTSHGIVYRIKSDDQQEINKISASQTRGIDQEIISVGFRSVEMRETGNMTYFIEVKRSDETHKVTWTESTKAPEIKALYKTLLEAL